MCEKHAPISQQRAVDLVKGFIGVDPLTFICCNFSTPKVLVAEERGNPSVDYIFVSLFFLSKLIQIEMVGKCL